MKSHQKSDRALVFGLLHSWLLNGDVCAAGDLNVFKRLYGVTIKFLLGDFPGRNLGDVGDFAACCFLLALDLDWFSTSLGFFLDILKSTIFKPRFNIFLNYNHFHVIYRHSSTY